MIKQKKQQTRDTKAETSEMAAFIQALCLAIEKVRQTLTEHVDTTAVEIRNEVKSIESQMTELSDEVHSVFDASNLLEELQILSERIESIQLKEGLPGKDGQNYILTDSDKKEISSAIEVPIIERVIEKTEVVKEVPVIRETVKETITVEYDPSPLLKKIQELERIIRENLALPVTTTFFSKNGLNLGRAKNINLVEGTGVTLGVTLIGDTANVSVSAAASGFQAPTSGTVNGVNATFVWATAPTVIVTDQGRAMQKTSSDGTVNWSGTSTTILSIAPNFDLYALA